MIGSALPAGRSLESSEGGESPGVRRAALVEAPAIAAVLSRSFAEYRALYTDMAFRATTASLEDVWLRFAEGPVWVAAQDGEIVGTVAAASRGDRLLLRGMAVLPQVRGRRIGDRLLVEAERFAVAGGYTNLVLSTTPFLHRAIRLYERFGFRRTEDGPRDLFGTPLFTMVKRLA